MDRRGARDHLPDELQHLTGFQQIGLLLAGPFANLIPGNYLAWLTGHLLIGNTVTGGIWMFATTLMVLGLTQLLPWHPRCDSARAWPSCAAAPPASTRRRGSRSRAAPR